MYVGQVFKIQNKIIKLWNKSKMLIRWQEKETCINWDNEQNMLMNKLCFYVNKGGTF